MFKVNKNTRTTSFVLVIYTRLISHLFLLFLFVDFEQVNVSWEVSFESMKSIKSLVL